VHEPIAVTSVVLSYARKEYEPRADAGQPARYGRPQRHLPAGRHCARNSVRQAALRYQEMCSGRGDTGDSGTQPGVAFEDDSGYRGAMQIITAKALEKDKERQYS
jgi:hypothetical protein